MIWIFALLILILGFYIYSKVVDPSEALYKKILKEAIDEDPRYYPGDLKKTKKFLRKRIEEIESDHDLYLRLLERFKNKKELKNIKDDYYEMVHAKDEINSIISIDPERMASTLQKYQIKVEEIGKRFRAYGLEKVEP